MPPPRPLEGRIAFITGAGGGIGAAIARRFAAEGAAVVLADIDPAGLDGLCGELGENAIITRLDVSREDDVDQAFEAAVLAFGGVDIAVNCAGISSSHTITDTTLEEFERMHAVISRGSFLVSRAMARLAVAQRIAADIVYVVSKNAIFAGAANVAYASAKAAQLHQMRVVAAELGPLGIRVNGVNPDAVVRGSKIFAGDWGDQRAATYGVEREKLGDFYAERTILKQEVLPEDVAAACFALVGGALSKTTGHVIPVDGGVAAAFLR
jgi:NAD(P)-dependent dehydrogenase (short-subunit alcohol dehydrogenase family)